MAKRMPARDEYPYTLWGFDGDLSDNEDRLMFCLPFMKDSTGKIVAVRKIMTDGFWEVHEIGHETHEDIRDHGVQLDLPEDVFLKHEEGLAVLGPDFPPGLPSNLPKHAEGWVAVQEGFFVKPMTESDWCDLREVLGLPT